MGQGTLFSLAGLASLDPCKWKGEPSCATQSLFLFRFFLHQSKQDMNEIGKKSFEEDLAWGER